MKISLKMWLLLPFYGLMSACSTKPVHNLNVINNFESSRYLGIWYEIARLDHSFERGLEQVNAHYSSDKNDGSIQVTNTGFNTTRQKWESAKGTAYFVGDPTLGALKVTFFWPFYGAYNIIALDSDYQNALVAGPNYRYLWLLSRNKTMPDTIKENYLEIAQKHGFDINKLIWVTH